METQHLLNNLWLSERRNHVTAVYTDGIFPFFPIMPWNSIKHRQFKLSWENDYKLHQLNVVPARRSPRPQLPRSIARAIFFPVCNLYFFSFSLQPCYGTLPIQPSGDKTNVVYPLQPLDETQRICICVGFFFLFLVRFQNSCFTLRWKIGYGWVTAKGNAQMIYKFFVIIWKFRRINSLICSVQS